MKIAIPASGPNLTDPVDSRFGRAPYFILISPEKNETTAIENPFCASSGGVGPRVVQELSRQEVTHLIAPKIGGNAETALLAAGIEVFLFENSGSVSSALDLLNTGKLPRISEQKSHL